MIDKQSLAAGESLTPPRPHHPLVELPFPTLSPFPLLTKQSRTSHELKPGTNFVPANITSVVNRLILYTTSEPIRISLYLISI